MRKTEQPTSRDTQPDHDLRGGKARAQQSTVPTLANRIADLQRVAGNAAVTAAVEQARQAGTAQAGGAHDAGHDDTPSTSSDGSAAGRSPVHDVLRSAGIPLDDATRVDMEARLGADFSTVRLHTGATAQRSAAEVGARAYTSGEHVVIGEGGADRHTLAHELTHVVQQRQGPVAGTDDGTGLSVSDPTDAFERAAEATARRALSGPAPDAPAATPPAPEPERGAVLQRYSEVAPGEQGYPQKRVEGQPAAADDDRFFVSQEQQQGRWFTPESTDQFNAEANIVNNTDVPLRLSEKLNLAIEDTGRQAKVFFATQDKIDKANERLRGQLDLTHSNLSLTLERQRRHLMINLGTQTVVLWQVVPRLYGPDRPSEVMPMQVGLDVRLAQRCDDTAEKVTGRVGATADYARVYFHTLADILGEGDPEVTAKYKDNYDEAAARATEGGPAAADHQLTYRTIAREMVQYAQELPADTLDRMLRTHKLSRYMERPKVSDIVMIRGSEGGVPYHFAGVVATDGSDYVTLENFARHDPVIGDQTASSGDPLWYFQMYGTDTDAETFYDYWTARGDFGQMVITTNMPWR